MIYCLNKMKNDHEKKGQKINRQKCRKIQKNKYERQDGTGLIELKFQRTSS